MRAPFFHKMAPRGAHAPDAKFLKLPPPQITYCDVQSLAKVDLSKSSSPQAPLSSVKQVNCSTQKPMTKPSSSPTSTIKNSKIPSSNVHVSSDNTAPVSHSKIISPTEEFRTVLRGKKNNSKFFKFSPKNYYHNSKKSSARESSKQSVFTQYSKLLSDEDASTTMNAEPQSNAVPVSPEKDTTMKEVSTCNQMSPEEEQSLLEEFDPATQEPPPKQPKTRGGAPVDLTTTPDTQAKKSPPQPEPTPPELPNGTNVGMFTATKIIPQGATNDIKKAPSIAQQNACTNAIPVSSIVKNIITCRFKLLIKGYSCNLPHLAKQVVKLYRSADSSLQILPFNASPTANNVLDTEENLPHEEEDIKTWVVKAEVVRDRLHFSMKFSSIKTIPALSKRIFPWMKANKSFVQMDKIDSETITCLGLFEGLHPDFRNRDLFKQYCLTHIKKYNPTIKPEISIYPRGVFAGAGLDKVESRAVVIEVASDIADFVLQTLTHPFEANYSDVTFVPFTKTDDSYSSILRQVLIHHNTMLHNTKRKILHGLKNIDEHFTMNDGKILSIRQWLLSAQSDETSTDEPLIQHVDFTTKNSISVIFDAKYESILHSLLRHIDQELSKYYPKDVLNKVYEDTAPHEKHKKNERIFTESERLWAEHIKRKYAVNPQGDQNDFSTPPNKNRKVIYHGPSEVPNQLQANTFDPSPSSSQTSIEQRLSQLETQAKENNATQNALIQKTIETSMHAVESKLVIKSNEKYTELSEKMQILETKTVNTFQTLNTNIASLTTNVSKLCASLLPPESTTKDDMTSESGKNK